MTDHWPRFEVFKQEREGQPHRNVGSVHAPDAELALLSARDVFARRPACHSLWVVPAAAVSTNHEVPLLVASGPMETYAVCAKQSNRQAMTYVDYLGCVEAHSPAEALQLAATTFGGDEGGVWWVFPEAAVTTSQPEDALDYGAATSKLFRLPNQYHTVVTMRQMRRGEAGAG